MRVILPIFHLTLRGILRERVALSMLALLALVLGLLPGGIDSDGTLEGALRMHLRYSLGISSALLALMTVWVSCAAIAADVSVRRAHLLLSKPVHRWELWMGKWLAVISLTGVLMLICGGVTLLRMRALLREANPESSRLAELRATQLTARREIRAEEEDLRPEALRRLEQHREAGLVPPELTEEAALRDLLRFVRVQRHSAAPGSSVKWRFTLQHPLREGESLQLAYHYDGAAMGPGEVPGRWRLRSGGTEWAQLEVSELPRGEFVRTVSVPAAAEGAGEVELQYENLGGEGDQVFFKPAGGVRLYRQGSGLLTNLIKALLLVWGLLAILAAIGVSAGALFSLPVACYVTAGMLLMQGFSGSLEEALANPPAAGADEQSAFSRGVQTLRTSLYRGTLRLLKPLQVEGPYDRLSRGVLIPVEEVAEVFLFRFLPVLLFIGGAGNLLFRRREVGGNS